MNSSEPLETVRLASSQFPSGAAWLLNFFLHLKIGIFAHGYTNDEGMPSLWEFHDNERQLRPEADHLKLWIPALSQRARFQFRNECAIRWTHEFPSAEDARQKTILLVRDGRDAVYSWYKRLIDPKPSFTNWLDQPVAPLHMPPPETWALFNIQWQNTITPQNLHIIQFESLKQNPETAAFDLLKFLGLSIDRFEIESAVAACDISNAQKAERLLRDAAAERSYRPIHRRGAIFEWKETYTPRLLQKFAGMPNEVLNRFGYAIENSLVSDRERGMRIHAHTLWEKGQRIRSLRALPREQRMEFLRDRLKKTSMESQTGKIPAHLRENVYGHAERFRWIEDQIRESIRVGKKTRASLKILDVGCGTGAMITIPLGRKGYRILGIDTDAKSIEAAKSNETDTMHFQCVPLDTLEEKNFDVIICSEVLEHLSDPEALLLSLRNHLADNGILLLTTPNGYGWFEMEKFLYEKLGFRYLVSAIAWLYWNLGIKKLRDRLRKTPVSQQPEISHTLKDHDIHLQHFTLSRLRRMFEKFGLSLAQGRGSTLMAGPLTDFFLQRFRSFLKLNVKIGRRVPLLLASGWYFCLKKNEK